MLIFLDSIYYLPQGIMFLVLLVCLPVCLLATLLKKSHERITTKFDGGAWGGKTDLDFGHNPDHHADCPIGNPAFLGYLTNYEPILMKFQDSAAMIKRTIQRTRLTFFSIALFIMPKD